MNCKGKVTCNGKHPVANATVILFKAVARAGEKEIKEIEVARTRTGEDGYYILPDIPEGEYLLRCKHFGETEEKRVQKCGKTRTAMLP